MTRQSEIFDDIYNNYGFGGKKIETRSGPGSTLEATKGISEFILDVVSRYGIKSVVDLPCGDFNWMCKIAHNFDSYIGLDISKTCIKDNKEKYPDFTFKEFDVLNGNIPDCDLLIVRDMLGHMPLDYSRLAFENIKKSNWSYLIGTHFMYIRDDGSIDIDKQFKHLNTEITDFGQCFLVNLMSEPLNLGTPVEFIHDMREHNKVQALWSRVPKEYKITEHS